MSDEKRIEVANRMYRNRGGAFWEEDMFHAWGTEAVRLVDPQTGEILDALYEARQRIIELEAERARWVPVTERLPVRDGLYHIWSPDNGEDWDEWKFDRWEYKESTPTHWLDNVPPPPQGETDE